MGPHADLLISEALVPKMIHEEPEEYSGDFHLVATVYRAAAVCECSEEEKRTKEEEVQSNEARIQRAGKGEKEEILERPMNQVQREKANREEEEAETKWQGRAITRGKECEGEGKKPTEELQNKGRGYEKERENATMTRRSRGRREKAHKKQLKENKRKL